MSSNSSEPSNSKSGTPKEEYRTPGLRGVRQTSLFRAVNPELFIKPNKPVMVLDFFQLQCVLPTLPITRRRK
ncbi:hypothetical protein GDO86_009817 [Hymenochirus boettgeri]|uniref:Small integral membrane protein 8 n=1 Tax=Hymenochirus boettgeri TaxID=247094 RepID=A0A8T2JHZ8_9PIPI|nr:hypothetical protein GDO86_009817 [Hymenochirus boettgeri]